MTIDLIEVSESGVLSIREVLSDGTYHRRTLTPGAALDGEPQEVLAAAQEAWTPGVLSDWEAKNSLPPVELADLKTSLKAQIDADAEAQRLKYITPGAGQVMAYLQKAMEATTYLSATDPDPADYPLLTAEVGITGNTIADVAAVVDAHYQAWRVIGAAIEQARLGGKAAVDAAETAEDAQAAYDAVTWPDPLSA